MTTELKMFHTEQGCKTVLVSDKGRKYLHLLMMDGQLVVRKIPKTEERYLRDVVQEKKIPALTTLVRKFRAYGKRNGMTKSAKSMLREVTQ